MNSFLNKVSITTSQWLVLDAIMRSIRTHPDLKIYDAPCITFRQVEAYTEPVRGAEHYHYRITRDVGKGYFYARDVGKVLLVVSCKQTHAEYLTDVEGSYLYELYIGLRIADGKQWYLKLCYLDEQPVHLEPTAEEIPPELKEVINQ